MTTRIQEKLVKTFGIIEKRIRTILATGILTLGLFIATMLAFGQWWIVLPILCLVTFVAVYFALLEGIEGIEWLTLFIIPLSLSISFYLFYFLFPARWITRIPLLIIYTLLMYAIILTSNIFNVGAEKSLQLYRAAFSINYLSQILIIFILCNVILSFNLHFLLTTITVTTILFPFGVQMLWSLKPQITLDPKVIPLAALAAYMVSQIVLISSFITIPSSMVALLITATYYCLIGLMFHWLEERLFPQTVREYITVLIIMLIITILTIG